MKVELKIPGEPVGKGRPRFAGNGIVYTPPETRAYETMIKQLYSYTASVLDGGFPKDVPLKVTITAYYGFPKRSGRKQCEKMCRGEIRPTKKPDIDNVIKIICDALNGVAYHDDSQIVAISADKYYSQIPRVEVELKEVKKGDQEMVTTIKRAIEILDPAHRENYKELPDGMEQVEQACRLGMEALKKQIPIKPLPSVVHLRYVRCYDCPSCGQTISGTGVADYCYHCGQALDWREYFND